MTITMLAVIFTRMHPVDGTLSHQGLKGEGCQIPAGLADFDGCCNAGAEYQHELKELAKTSWQISRVQSPW